jgi:dCMP deaminase
MNEVWQHRFMALAEHISQWSKDPSTKIGAVAVSNERRILTTGYNGFPSRIEDTEARLQNREVKYDHVIHAEMNVILTAAHHGISLKDAWLFAYGLPICSNCANHVIQAGFSTIVINSLHLDNPRWSESWGRSKAKFQEAGIEVKII